MLEILQIIIAVGLGVAAYFYMFTPRRSQYEAKEEEQKSTKKELDFYGIKKFQSEPEKFLAAAQENQKKLERGEEIAVDAVHALYLIRNSKYHDLIVGENGAINLKNINAHEKLQKDADDVLEKIGHKVKFTLPEYVERVEDLADGGVRWVYKKEHAYSCGIESVCYDKNNRAMRCPEALLCDEQKNKGAKNKNGAKSFVPPAQHTKPVSIPAPDKFQSDIDLNFANIMNAENENQDVDEIQKNISVDEPDLVNILKVESTDGLPIENADEGLRYIDRESFTLDFKNKNLLEKVLQNVFDFKSAQNFIFIEYVNREIFIEKNYFFEAVCAMIQKNSVDKFKVDFLAGKSVEIFDGNLVERFVSNIDVNNIFLAYTQRGQKKVLYNLLLGSEDVEGVGFQGWFFKVDFSCPYFSTEFFSNMHGASVSVLASDKKSVESQAPRIFKGDKKLKVFY